MLFRSLPKEKRSDGVKYSFNRIDDIYRFLTPAMNEQHVNLKITGETATRHAENGDEIFYSAYTQHTSNGYDRQVWVYESDIEVTWVDADNPEDRQAVTLHAIGTNDGGRIKQKAVPSPIASSTTFSRCSALIRARMILTTLNTSANGHRARQDHSRPQPKTVSRGSRLRESSQKHRSAGYTEKPRTPE